MSRLTIQGSKDLAYKDSFDEVIAHYQELKHSSEAGIKGTDYSTMHDSSGNVANVVTVSKTDFICDVELAVRRALDSEPELLQEFSKVYVHLVKPENTQTPEIDRIRTLVGKAFVEGKLYPAKSYFKPKQLDRSKGAKKAA
jgi:hypothetical protein